MLSSKQVFAGQKTATGFAGLPTVSQEALSILK